MEPLIPDTIPTDPAALQELANDLAVRLETYRALNNTTWSAMGPLIGMHGSALGRYVSGTSSHRTADATGKILEFLKLETARAGTPMVGGFVETRIASTVISLSHKLHALSAIGLIQGPSGLGKSQAALRFQAKVNNGLIHYVRARTDYSASMLLRDLGKTLRCMTNGHRDTVEDAVLQRLHRNHMIIVDQVHDCKPGAIDELMTLHDQARCSMLLLGTARSADALRLSGGGQPEQFLDRLTIFVELEPEAKSHEWYTHEEIEAITRGPAPELSRDCVVWLHGFANVRGSLRLTMQVLQLALEGQSDSAKITVKALDTFRKLTASDRIPVDATKRTPSRRR